MKNLFKYIFFTLLTTLLTADVYLNLTEKTPFHYTPLPVSNGCLVDSIIFTESYWVQQKFSVYKTWAKIVAYRYKLEDGKEIGHAICVFLYKGTYFIYDPENGSFMYLPHFNPQTTPLIFVVKTVVPSKTIEFKIELEL